MILKEESAQMNKINDSLAPIVLFCYNRPEHLYRTITALRANELAQESRLIVYSDAPRDNAAEAGVREVRSFIRMIDGFASVDIVEQQENRRLAPQIIEELPKVLSCFGKAIVLEDDIVTSPYFLRFMNDGLDKYANDERVISIHGYNYPINEPMPETFFLKGADCWGWATWERGWDLFEQDGCKLMKILNDKNLLDRFDFFCKGVFSSLLKKQIDGVIDGWDIRWYASALVNDKLTLYPGKSLVKNIGLDGSGMHCLHDSTFDVELSMRRIYLSDIPIEENCQSLMAVSRFFCQAFHPGPLKRLLRKVAKMGGWG